MFLCPSCFLEASAMAQSMPLNAVIKASWGEVWTCCSDAPVISDRIELLSAAWGWKASRFAFVIKKKSF